MQYRRGKMVEHILRRGSLKKLSFKVLMSVKIKMEATFNVHFGGKARHP